MPAIGAIRDYYPWIFSEGIPTYTQGGAASPGYPNNLYKFNPAYQNQSINHLDVHYNAVANDNLVLNATMLQSTPHIVAPDLLPGDNNLIAKLEQKPVLSRIVNY